MNNVIQMIDDAASYIRNHIDFTPQIAIILGSGLGPLAGEITSPVVMKYSDIPHFKASAVAGHAGELIAGTIDGRKVLVMNGRFHYYEGHPMEIVTLPIRVFARLGIRNLLVTNAAGGIADRLNPGSVMLITDHLSMMCPSPLIGSNLDEFGPRFPDMSEAYSKELIRKADEIAEEKGIKVQHGVYIGTQGPTFETPAEYKLFHILGADAVGMSTVPEVIVANHCGITVFGISVITDLGVEGKIVEVTHEEVQKAADAAQPKMTTIMRELINRA